LSLSIFARCNAGLQLGISLVNLPP